MRKFEKFGFALLLIGSQCVAGDTPLVFDADELPLRQEEVIDPQNEERGIFSSAKKYISIDLAGIPSRNGIFNFGLRKEGEQLGYDLGVSSGKGPERFQCIGYGSLLCFKDISKKTKYYGGIGLRAGHVWKGSESAFRSFLAQGSFTVGGSFFTKTERNQFLELNCIWPAVYSYTTKFPYQHLRWERLHGLKKKEKGTYTDYRTIRFALFYGLFF